MQILKMQSNCKFQKITTAGVKESHIHDIAEKKKHQIIKLNDSNESWSCPYYPIY